MKYAKASEMRQPVKLLVQNTTIDPVTGRPKVGWGPMVKDGREVILRCRVKTIYREQLEMVVSGAQTLRDRLEFECRYTEMVTSAHRVEYKGKQYQVSIEGDTDGRRKRTRFLGERLTDGGAA